MISKVLNKVENVSMIIQDEKHETKHSVAEMAPHLRSAHLLAGEPMMTLWIRMPCVTSGKDESLTFNSAMMLKQKGQNRF